MASSPKDTRNIAILAHVDAGKTTVSERLLYFSEAIPGMGEVDEGLATMDYLEEEKKRGITIEAGIASYSWKGVRVTFVDTPGHVDFGVEVDFALRAVEGVVLVLSGISGIESQSLEAWEKIKSNHNRPIIFVNKLDLIGADHRRVLEQIQVMFGVKPVALTLPVPVQGAQGAQPPGIDGVVDVLNQLVLFRSVENPRKLIKGEIPAFLKAEYDEARKQLIDLASQFNDALLDAYLNGAELKNDAIMEGLRAAFAEGRHIPVYMGSALRNVGVRQLMNGVNQLLPPPPVPEDDAIVAGFIIKIRFYHDIGRIFLVKVYNPSALQGVEGRFYRVFAESLEELSGFAQVRHGDILALQSPRHYAIGEFLAGPGRILDGKADGTTGAVAFHKQYRPLLQSRIELAHADDYNYVEQTLRQLAETEPSISISPDSGAGGWLISTVGELQLDVFCKRLKKDHKCDIRVGAPSVRYLERIKGSQTGIENAAVGMGAELSLEMEAVAGEDDRNILEMADPAITPEYREVIQAGFDLFCGQGVCGLGPIAGLVLKLKSLKSTKHPLPLPLLSKCVTDCLRLNLVSSKFEVFEPIMRLEIIIPEEFCGLVLADLASRGGVVRKMDSDGYNSIILLEIPLAKTFGYTTLLRSLSKGLGVYVLTYEKHGIRRL